MLLYNIGKTDVHFYLGILLHVMTQITKPSHKLLVQKNCSIIVCYVLVCLGDGTVWENHKNSWWWSLVFSWFFETGLVVEFFFRGSNSLVLALRPYNVTLLPIYSFGNPCQNKFFLLQVAFGVLSKQQKVTNIVSLYQRVGCGKECAHGIFEWMQMT